jgi:antitoxin component YwqK of YwqJK toxin-antitoxin module
VPNRLDVSLPHIEMSNGEKHYILENGGKKIISYLKEEWFDKDGKLNREDGPANTEYYKNGNIEFELYSLNGKFHREDGPATVYYYENGSIFSKFYYLNGQINREDGPATIYYCETGGILSENYYLNGIQYSKKDYLEKIKDLNSCNKMS